MPLTIHLASLLAIAAAACLLIRIPRPLFAEAGEKPPSLKLEWGLAAVIGLTGIAAFEAMTTHTPMARLTFALVAMVCAATVYSDLSFLVIPDLYSATLAVLAFFAPWHLPWKDALLGVLFCGGLLALLAFVWRKMTDVEGLGFGDVKLAAALGAMLGAQQGLFAVSVSAAGAAVLAYAARLIKGRKDAEPLIPYGAALALAGIGFLAKGLL